MNNSAKMTLNSSGDLVIGKIPGSKLAHPLFFEIMGLGVTALSRMLRRRRTTTVRSKMISNNPNSGFSPRGVVNLVNPVAKPIL